MGLKDNFCSDFSRKLELCHVELLIVSRSVNSLYVFLMTFRSVLIGVSCSYTSNRS